MPSCPNVSPKLTKETRVMDKQEVARRHLFNHLVPLASTPYGHAKINFSSPSYNIRRAMDCLDEKDFLRAGKYLYYAAANSKGGVKRQLYMLALNATLTGKDDRRFEQGNSIFSRLIETLETDGSAEIGAVLCRAAKFAEKTKAFEKAARYYCKLREISTSDELRKKYRDAALRCRDALGK